VNQKDFYPDQNEELQYVRNLTGDITNRLAKNSLLILSTMDIHHLHLLSTNGASEEEILHTARYRNNGNLKSYHEMKRLMESVFGTTAILEQ
jgi:hypothetical protein